VDHLPVDWQPERTNAHSRAVATKRVRNVEVIQPSLVERGIKWRMATNDNTDSIGEN
jgi:hypothetical protein